MTEAKQVSLAPGLARIEKYSLQDYKQLLLRRKWQICTVALLVSLITATVALMLPNIYRSTTVILVDPRKVPDSFVMSTVSSSVADRLETLREQILSATRLAQIIDSFNLYADLRHKKTQEEIIDEMRKDIEVEVVASTTGDRGLGAFRVSYRSKNPNLAAQVTNRLASLFIEENLKAREEMVVGTTEFVDRELQDAKLDLDKKEAVMRGIKERNSSVLPESENMHLQALSALQLELRGEMDAANRAQQQKLYLESTLASSPSVVDLDKSNSSAPELQTLQMELSKQQGDLDQLRARYGPKYPEVLKRDAQIADLKRQIASLTPAGGVKRTPPAAKSKNPVLESQIGLLEEEIQKDTSREQDLKNQIAYHQSKLEQIPVVEQEIASATQDYNVAREHYKQLLDRKFSADMSSNLESYQKAERFVILDPAQVPEKPFQPNRPLLDAVGLAGGIGLGCLVAFILEVLDPTIRSEAEIPIMILGHVPVLPSPEDTRAHRRRTLFALSATTMMSFAFLLLCFLSRK